MSTEDAVPTVKDLRLSRGWYQPYLAERAKLSAQTIRKMEQGRHVSDVARYRVAIAFEREVHQIKWEF